MSNTLIKSRVFSNKQKPEIKQELSNTQLKLPPNLQTLK